MTSDFLQAVMFGLTDKMSLLQEATTVINMNLRFNGSFIKEDHKTTTLYIILLTFFWAKDFV